MMELVDKADFGAPQHGPAIIGQASAILSSDQHSPAIGTLQQAGNVQHRRLAGARRYDQRYDLT